MFLSVFDLFKIGIGNVVWNADGEAALDHFMVDPLFADIVIADLSLPGMDGVELMKRVRRINPKVPFLIMLADPTKKNVLYVREGGTKYILAKPVSTGYLIEHVEEMIRPLVGNDALKAHR